MDLVNVRKKFRELSGRYDLVNDDFSDKGANFYINEGSKWLDRTVETTKSWASYMAILTIGDWYVQFPLCRAIKEVWASTDQGRLQLDKIRLQDLIASFFTNPPAEWVNGTPLYFSPTLSRYIPEDITPATLATFAQFIGVMPVVTHDYNALLLSAPVDRSTLIEVVGLFYSKELVEDTDENYWSQVNPLILIQSAIRQTYVVGGNKPMLEILNTGISDELTKLGFDLVEQMIAEVDQMEG